MPHHPPIATVFGGTGFIGSQIVRRLARAGWHIRLPTRDPDKALPLLPAGNVGQIVPMVSDWRNDAALAALVGPSRLVVNCVGILYETRRQRFADLHGLLPGRLAAVSAALRVERFIHFSALGAADRSPSAYARSKAEGETAIWHHFPEATILRPSVVFGPGDGFFNLFAGLSMISPALPLIGGGKTRFQPVYVGDLAAAVLSCVNDMNTKGKLYECGGPAIYDFAALLRLMLRSIGRERLLLPLPWGIARVIASVIQLLPRPMLTVDQVRLLAVDNVVAAGHPGLIELGVMPTALELILPTYLDRFLPGGRFAAA